MCGIVGYVGNENTVDKLHKGLKSLEYRGYDSAGIAFFCEKSLKIIKSVGCVDCLFEKVHAQKCTDKSIGAGIGHTRWATHGKASENNSHPHQSEQKRVCIVHNGIIENFQELKNRFLNDTKFASETDTEVVANLIEFEYLKQIESEHAKNIQKKYSENKHAKMLDKESNFEDVQAKLWAIQTATKLLKGSYALGILFSNDPYRIYFAKQTSPILIGMGKSGNFLASDILGFDDTATEYIEVQDGQFGYISPSDVQIFDNSGKNVKTTPKKLNKSQENVDLGKFSHYMLKEIYEIPNSIINISKFYSKKDSLFYLFSKKHKNRSKDFFENISRVHLVACGTSFHASKAGEIWLKQIGFDASTEIASEFIYSPQILDKNTLCIFTSQSGETADTLSAVKLAKKKNAKTIGITNVETSTLSKICDLTLPILCGPEIAVASTKAYNAELCVLKILAEFLKYKKCCNKSTKQTFMQKGNTASTKTEFFQKNQQKEQKYAKKWQKSVQKLQKIAKFIDISKFCDQIKCLTKPVLDAEKIFMVGKNFDYVLAMESALKLKEISYLSSEAYPSGELKHGTISLVDNKTLVFAFATEKNLLSKTLNIVEQVHSRGGKVVLVSPFTELSKSNAVSYFVQLPEIPESYMPLVSIIPMQLLAYNVSVALGNNPDKPRNLAKSVTVE